MSTKTYIPIFLAFMACCATSRADITAASWWDDHDGALTCNVPPYNSSTSTLSMTGDQFWGPGHMVGTITTDSATDPTLFLGSAVDNDTSFAWTSYVVNVVMNAPFTFFGSPSVVNYPPSGPSDWSVASVTTPALQGSGLYAGDYEGTIDLTGGTPVQVGDELDFSYAIHFSSSTDYAFTQEMIPQTVPEPSELGLLTMSGLLFGGFQTVKRWLKKA